MALNVVEIVNGRLRVSWPGALVLFLGLVAGCAAIPAFGFWLAFGDARLVSTAVAVGLWSACFSFTLLLGQQRRLQLARLPTRN